MVHEITLFGFMVMGACMVVWLFVGLAVTVTGGSSRESQRTDSLLMWACALLIPSAVAAIVVVGAVLIASAVATIAWIGTLV